MRRILVTVIMIALVACTRSHHWGTYEARSHVGESGEVCGTVADVNYEAGVSGSPTFIDFERSYPDAVFVGLVWGEDRAAWGSPPEDTLKEGDHACVVGTIKQFRGTPEIEINDPQAQIR